MLAIFSGLVFFIFIYGAIGMLTGMIADCVYDEVDVPSGVDQSHLSVATGALWPISIPVLVIWGATHATRLTWYAVSDSFVGLWAAYVNRIEEKVK